MIVEVRQSCPLGHTCEKVAEDHIERCAWYTKVEGNNPQTGEYMSEYRCAIAWMPVLQVDQSGKTVGVMESVVSLRNETIKRQDAAMAMVKADGSKIIASQ